MTVPKFRSLDEVRAACGTVIGPTPWLPVTQDRIHAFADATGDHQWIHVDSGRAAAGPFQTTIAHGYLTLSLISWFGTELFELDLGGPRVNYGVNKVRFPAPVPAGGRLRASATFVELHPAPTGTQLTTRYTIECDGSAKPACVAETVTVLLP